MLDTVSGTLRNINRVPLIKDGTQLGDNPPLRCGKVHLLAGCRQHEIDIELIDKVQQVTNTPAFAVEP
ncbi:MAG: hypothetical protein AAFU54_23615 [Chloroflexota bacterium]